MLTKLKEFIADFMDAICSEDYAPGEFKLIEIDGVLYVYPKESTE